MAAAAVDAAIRRVWRQLLGVIREPRGPAHAYHRAAGILRTLPSVVAGELRAALVRLFVAGRRAALATVAAHAGGAAVREAAEPPRPRFVRHPKAKRNEVLVHIDPARLDADWQKDESYYLPPEYQGRGKSEIPGRRQGFRDFLATGQAVQAPRVDRDPQTGTVKVDDGRHRLAVLRDLGVSRVGVMVPRELADEFRRLYGAAPPPPAAPLDLLPGPSFDLVRRLLDRFVRPAEWHAAGDGPDRRMPEDLAQQLAAGVSLGQSPQQLAKGLLPYLDGSRVRARRAARTFGLVVSHYAQTQAWDELGDMVVGYQVHATLDQHTRPEHRARDGQIYFKNPRPGQLGLNQMPRPPLEADGSVSWNCRCWLSPVLGEPDEQAGIRR